MDKGYANVYMSDDRKHPVLAPLGQYGSLRSETVTVCKTISLFWCEVVSEMEARQ
jgi:hypothetical protein